MVFGDVSAACVRSRKQNKEFITERRLIPGHNQSLVSGIVLDIPSSHSEAGHDVLESMTSLLLTDIFK